MQIKPLVGHFSKLSRVTFTFLTYFFSSKKEDYQNNHTNNSKPLKVHKPHQYKR